MDEETSRRVCSLIAGVVCSDGRDVAEELSLLPEATRHETLNLLVQAAAADGQIVASERALLGVVAQQLGVTDEDLEARLQQALAGG
jgi:uncharacterized tellurite resistance protein B-like protein